ncbi:MAG: FAD-dependent oxidoreductase [Thermoprotei archaeon]
MPPSLFGIPGVARHTLSLKSVQDGEAIRNRVLSSFEKAACLEGGDPDRASLLTVVVVGGGATGVELAGTMRDYTKLLAKRHGITERETKVILLEAAETLLPGVGGRLSEKCRRDLESAGIEVRLKARVVKVGEEGVHLSDGALIRSSNVFWTAGVKPNPVVETIPETLAPKRKGMLVVDAHLRVVGHPEVYAVGDNAWVEVGGGGAAAPLTAAVAVDEGIYAGAHLAHLLGGGQSDGGFVYRDKGTMLSLGRFSGLVKLPSGIILSGFAGWFVWRMVHLVSVATARNRVGVMFDWTFSLLRRRLFARTD